MDVKVASICSNGGPWVNGSCFNFLGKEVGVTVRCNEPNRCFSVWVFCLKLENDHGNSKVFGLFHESSPFGFEFLEKESQMSRFNMLSRKPVMMLAFALAMVISIAAVRPASAAVVDYSTTGVFASSSSDTSTSGADTLTYTSVTSTGNLTPTIISLGELKLTGAESDTFSDSFTLTVSQIAPGSGTGSLSASVSGALTVSSGSESSSVTATFSTTTFTIAGVKYTLLSNPIFVPDPLSNGGRVTIEAKIDTAAVPVPAAVWSGMGLIGLIAVGKLRRFSAAA